MRSPAPTEPRCPPSRASVTHNLNNSLRGYRRPGPGVLVRARAATGSPTVPSRARPSGWISCSSRRPDHARRPATGYATTRRLTDTHVLSLHLAQSVAGSPPDSDRSARNRFGQGPSRRSAVTVRAGWVCGVECLRSGRLPLQVPVGEMELSEHARMILSADCFIGGQW